MPLGQLAHVVELVARMAVENLPAGQLVQALAAENEYVPAAQLAHVLLPAAENVPSEQGWQPGPDEEVLQATVTVEEPRSTLIRLLPISLGPSPMLLEWPIPS